MQPLADPDLVKIDYLGPLCDMAWRMISGNWFILGVMVAVVVAELLIRHTAKGVELAASGDTGTPAITPTRSSWSIGAYDPDVHGTVGDYLEDGEEQDRWMAGDDSGEERDYSDEYEQALKSDSADWDDDDYDDDHGW